MASMPKSYVGITGFETGAQVGAVRAALPTDRLLMVGCGIHGKPPDWNPFKWPNRCPPTPRLSGIFLPYNNVLNILHIHPDAGFDLFENLSRAHEAAGPCFHGFQLNTMWPSVKALVQYKKRHPGACITIALQEESLDAVNWEPKAVARRLALYGDTFDRVILDPSAGEGKAINVDFTRRTYEAIEKLLPNVGLVAAGGLHGDNAEESLSDLLRQFALSTDAESKLRDFPADLLNMRKAIRYVQATDALLRKHEAHRNPQPVN